MSESQPSKDIKKISEIKEPNETEVIKNIQETISREFEGYILKSDGVQELPIKNPVKFWLFTIDNSNSAAHRASLTVSTLDYMTVRDAFLNVKETFEKKAIEKKANDIIEKLHNSFSEYGFMFSGVQEGFGHVHDMYMFTITKEGADINGITIHVKVLDFDVIKNKVSVKIAKHRLDNIKEAMDNAV
jgi:hypothetical protein